MRVRIWLHLNDSAQPRASQQRLVPLPFSQHVTPQSLHLSASAQRSHAEISKSPPVAAGTEARTHHGTGLAGALRLNKLCPAPIEAEVSVEQVLAGVAFSTH